MTNEDSQTNVDLWVCPNCHILGGIETRIEKKEIICNCLSCGTNLSINEVSFLTPHLVKAINTEVLDLFPTYFHDDIRFSWLSNKTLGIIFSVPMDELKEDIDFDIQDTLEEELSEKFNMNITVYFD